MQRNTRRKLGLTIGAMLGGLTTTLALADGGRHRLDEMVGESDLIIRGVVQDIQYVLSNPDGPTGRGVPHTFVTYRVTNTLRGGVEEELITLRFIGGLDQEAGRYMESSITPQFDLGDEDILFIRDNNASQCPLVENQAGRLRIIDGRVYNEMGHELDVDGMGMIQTGPRHWLEEVATTTVAGRVFSLDLGPQAVMGPSNAIFAEQFEAEINWAGSLLGAPAAAFASADPNLPFDGPDQTAAAPPAMTEADRSQADLDPEERADAQRAERDAVRPVRIDKD